MEELEIRGTSERLISGKAGKGLEQQPQGLQAEAPSQEMRFLHGENDGEKSFWEEVNLEFTHVPLDSNTFCRHHRALQIAAKRA